MILACNLDQGQPNFPATVLPEFLEKKLSTCFLNDTKYIGFAPGAGLEKKIWNIENYINLAKYFQKKIIKLFFS